MLSDVPRDDEACRARGCASGAPVCGKTPAYEVRAGGYRTFLCKNHAVIERAEARKQAGHSQARCRNHAYEEQHFPDVKPAPCNFVRASREGRPVWGWEVMR